MDTRALEAWFKERPAWLQDAARRLLRSGELTESDIHELMLLCKREAGIAAQNGDALKAEGIPPGVLAHRDETVELTLSAISEVQGVNALAPRKPLLFGGNNLTIIYGRNGAGKSAYVRILKHACGARHLGSVHSDVSKPRAAFQGCKFGYTVNGQSKELAWKLTDGIHPELSAVEVYDTRSGEVYVNRANEVAFEPGLLAFFQRLVEVCDEVARELDSEILAQVSKKPILPPVFAATAVGQWYQKVSTRTTKEEVEKYCAWSETDGSILAQLRARLAEANPKDKAAALRKQKKHLTDLANDLRRIADVLSPESCATFIAARNDARAKRQAASVDAQKVFENAPLAGVGSESWRLLWEQARKYSESEAYEGIDFPHTAGDARCVLCHQPLEDDAKERLRAFERFVKGGLEQEAQSAEQHLVDLQRTLPEVPSKETVGLHLDSAGISEEKDRQAVLDLLAVLENRRVGLVTGSKDRALSEQVDREAIALLDRLSNSLEEQALVYDADAARDNRIEVQRQLTEAEAKQWISQQKASIDAEIACLVRVAQLEEARRLTNTQALTKMKSELAEEFVTAAFIGRFEEECRKLGASYIGAEIVKSGAGKGRVFHQIRLRNNKAGVPTAEILSEGEFRIISLTAFLADVEGRRSKTPIVFDDPISSLDQDYEEATVARLVQLCKDHQVIVFTHRLSLLALLQEAARKENIEPYITAVEREPWSTGEPAPAPFEAQKPKAAINTLLDEVEKARRVWKTEGRAAYEMPAQAICSKLRKTLERIVEDDLLAGVIQRFRREVQTKNKLEKLTKISQNDTRLLDEMMSKYSSYEHSQPRDVPVQLPGPDELRADLERLQAWRDSFEMRKPAA
ncbi:restriction endonuclease [Sulfurifustis variabilis]|uniref:Restriction endonuclease n=1 Tax=Sulfurifustis variabilis TaxID=1675686 RepID=A0A1B4V7S8_9GAMM|nr:AAA family ATPase [Sulfurifustis variabilis]BAU49576.1 restriction endonuclease [Sulfurifustis variabilis]